MHQQLLKYSKNVWSRSKRWFKHFKNGKNSPRKGRPIDFDATLLENNLK